MDCCGLNLGGMESCLKNYDAVGYEAAIREVVSYDQFLGVGRSMHLPLLGSGTTDDRHVEATPRDPIF